VCRDVVLGAGEVAIIDVAAVTSGTVLGSSPSATQIRE
jgi:hypothetical protein